MHGLFKHTVIIHVHNFLFVLIYVVLKELCKCPLQWKPDINGIVIWKKSSYSQKT